MQFPPQAYLVGAAKSGTTTLANLLSTHPALHLAKPKEPDWFTVGHRSGVGLYRNCFRGAAATDMLLDASTSYAAAPPDGPDGGIPALIHRHRSDARIILLVRDPVQRAWSSYWHGVRAGDETRSASVALSDPLSVHIRAGMYWQRLQEFRAVFAAESLCLVDMRDLKNDPQATAQRVAVFLGLDPGAIAAADATGSHRNSGFQWNGAGKLLQQVLGNESLQFLARISGALLPTQARQWLKTRLTRPLPVMPGDLAGSLCAQFAEDSARLHTDYGVETRTGPWWREYQA